MKLVLFFLFVLSARAWKELETCKTKGVCPQELMSAGSDYTCSVTSAGWIECFGSDESGKSNGYKPKRASTGKFVSVSTGQKHTCGLTSEGLIECFGDSKYYHCKGSAAADRKFGKFGCNINFKAD